MSTVMLVDELLAYLFDGETHFLAEPMTGWLASSRRFTAFVQAHHNKIRKKLRTAQDVETLRDLQLELETAYLLLREKSLSVAYEPQHPELGRSPDFAVTFTTSLTFMVEVTRMRTSPATAREDIDTSHPALLLAGRFTDTLCSKLWQLLSQRANVLVVGMETVLLTHDEVQSTLLRVKQRAEANDAALIERHGYRDRADFFRYYQRLSALLVRGVSLQTGQPAAIWINPQAKYPLPSKVHTALTRSHTL